MELKGEISTVLTTEASQGQSDSNSRSFQGQGHFKVTWNIKDLGHASGSLPTDGIFVDNMLLSLVSCMMLCQQHLII